MARIRYALILLGLLAPIVAGCSLLMPPTAKLPTGMTDPHHLPNVAGLTAQDARTELTAAGLSVEELFLSNATDAARADLLVVSQRPEAGQNISDAGPVTLTVGLASTPKPSDGTGRRGDRAYVQAVLHDWADCLAELNIHAVPLFAPESANKRAGLAGTVSVASLTWNVGVTNSGAIENYPVPGTTVATLNKVGC